METGAKKPAAAADNTRQQAQQQALFEAKHAEVLSEARDMAREFGVDVHAVAFRPDGTAVRHEFLGIGREARLKGLISRAVAKDVSAMGLEEVTAHEQHLQRLRSLVAHELQVKAAKARAAAPESTKRSPEQQEVAGAAAGSSSSKTRRIE
ncbi:hypothetical protein GQ55_2G461200 [Panicum hallii var. hallii]|uniref:MADS-box domain-containing protein n=1 Tax=Panicum hallii var. hallii TaxID=1504633 RepID=A0A2T7EZN6_9POAL|nr:hypothetical protein GQ55_2G461200 [Panicum hallii var. hallii]